MPKLDQIAHTIDISDDSSVNIDGHDVTVDAIKVRLEQLSQPQASSSSNLVAATDASISNTDQTHGSLRP